MHSKGVRLGNPGRLGAPRFLGSILALWGLVASLFAWMRVAPQFYALRFVLGLAESGAYPGNTHPFLPSQGHECIYTYILHGRLACTEARRPSSIH